MFRQCSIQFDLNHLPSLHNVVDRNRKYGIYIGSRLTVFDLDCLILNLVDYLANYRNI